MTGDDIPQIPIPEIRVYCEGCGTMQDAKTIEVMSDRIVYSLGCGHKKRLVFGHHVEVHIKDRIWRRLGKKGLGWEKIKEE